MELTIDFASSTPIYTQIRDAIIKAIASGQLAPGEPLPSIRALGSALGVNLHTVNKAYAELADEGFVQMRRGLGAVIATSMPVADREYQQSAAPKIEALIAEAKLRNVNRQTLVDMINNLYGEMG